MFTWHFWRETLERAIKSAAQAPLTIWMVGDVALNVFEMDWNMGFGVAAGGFILSVLTSIASTSVGASNSPSAID